MVLEVVDELVAAIEHETRGLVAQLATMPRTEGDIEIVAPQIINMCRDDAGVKGEQLDRGSDILICVAPEGPTTFAQAAANIPNAEFGIGLTPVSFTIVHRGDVTTSEKIVQSLYVMRGLVLALKSYFLGKNIPRTRNEITILRALNVEAGLVKDDGVGAIGAIAFTVQAFDKRAQPSG